MGMPSLILIFNFKEKKIREIFENIEQQPYFFLE